MTSTDCYDPDSAVIHAVGALRSNYLAVRPEVHLSVYFGIDPKSMQVLEYCEGILPRATVKREMESYVRADEELQ